MTVVPAHGRDYKSKKEILAHWNEGKDFIIADAFDPYDGKAINKEDAEKAGKRTINVRYAGLRKIAVLTFKVGEWK